MFKCPGKQFGNKGQDEVINDFEDQYRRMTTTDVLKKYIELPISPILHTIRENPGLLGGIMLILIQLLLLPILIVVAILGLLFIAPIEMCCKKRKARKVLDRVKIAAGQNVPKRRFCCC